MTLIILVVMNSHKDISKNSEKSMGNDLSADLFSVVLSQKSVEVYEEKRVINNDTSSTIPSYSFGQYLLK